MALIDPSILKSLGFLFSKTVTIQEQGAGRDSYGAENGAWADKAGHVAIPCVVSPASAAEAKKADATYTRNTYKVLLQGHYPLIKSKMRAIVGIFAYDVTGVLHDSQDVMTTLICEVIE